VKTMCAACAVGAVVAVLVLGTSVTGVVNAQGRGGRGAASAAGTVEKVVVHGKSLEGNLEGDSPDRAATVYLPPTYASDQSRRFPVIYLLHGYGGQEDTFTERLASLQQSSDTLAAGQGFSSAIVVTPSAYSLHKGSMYSSSPTTGDWERFIAEDLVAYMDSHYRTLADRMSRGLAGHSMGGYGALRIGMKRPDVFFSLYLMSSCCLTANRNPNPESMAASEAIKTREQAVEAASGRGFGPSVNLASAAAWSPNPKNPPLYLDLPIGDNEPAVLAKWTANAPLAFIDQYVPGLRRYRAIAIDVGDQDGLRADAGKLHEALDRYGIANTFEIYPGTHTSDVAVRFQEQVMPFFSRTLSFAPVKR